jgi:predicted DNA-binding protein YlxM (UPF0122 family)
MKLETYIINVSFLFIVFFTLVSTSVLAIYGPTPSRPSCTPATCQSLGKQCGTWPDGCGGTINCGSCQSGYTCNPDGQCIQVSPPTQQQPQQESTKPIIGEDGFRCSDLPTMRERIACRIKLKQENELNYLPEECRVLTGLERAKCINNYKNTIICFNKESDEERVNCARRAIGLQIATIQQAREDCKGNQTCLNELKEKVFTLIKFRFYNLEYKAQEIMEKYNISESLVVDFISSIETKKQEFNNARSIEEKKQIIKDVIILWRQFIDQVKSEIRSKR